MRLQWDADEDGRNTRARRPAEEESMKCEFCGRQVQDPNTMLQQDGHKFCSQSCADDFRRDKGVNAT